ncbi:Uncharacterised protein [uncultured archaeon]|nr:Uncharacterised protein [uncultured archaeon]
MTNYIVCSEQLKQEFHVEFSQQNNVYSDIIEKSYCSDTIIWNAFAPWKYSDNKKNPCLIGKMIEKVFKTKLDDTDFKNNSYSFFGHTPSYFRHSKPDLVVNDNNKNCLILESKFTEDSSKTEEKKCDQVTSYLCDIFHKLCLNKVTNPYFMILFPKKTGKYYEYFQIIETHKNNIDKIRESLKDCLERRKKKDAFSYNTQYNECYPKLWNKEGDINIKKISENIALFSWEDFKILLLFECINDFNSKNYGIDDWDQYQKFFNDRADIDFLLNCLVSPKSNLTT